VILLLFTIGGLGFTNRRHCRMAARFKRLAVGVPALVVTSFLIFVAFRKTPLPSAAPAKLAFSGVAGAVHLAVAVWAAASVASLAAKLVRTSVLASAGPKQSGVIFRTVGGVGDGAATDNL